jgi:hypothetical protein
MYMVNTDVKKLLEESKQELAELLRQRDLLNVAIIQREERVRGLSAIALRDQLTQGQKDAKQPLIGITEAIRSVLRLKNKPMTAPEVKADLEMMGYHFKGFSNPSAMVHNTLKRMAENGELLRDHESKTFQLHSTFFGN